MKKLAFTATLLGLSCLLLSFSSVGNDRDKYLPAHCHEPIHFEIESQEPCNVFEVNPDNGRITLLEGGLAGLCGNFDVSNEDRKIRIRYNVTNADGTREGHFIILDLENEE